MTSILNLEDKFIDRPIYRVFSLKRFKGLFNDRTNVLVNPQKWDDPFENFMIENQKYLFKGGYILTTRDSDCCFGQCWTLNKESDAIWRIYAPNKDGVKVKTTIRKLLDSLESHLAGSMLERCYIGKVQYKSIDKLRKVYRNVDNHKGILGGNATLMAQMLLLKRLAFSHEKEIRLIYITDVIPNFKIYEYPIEPKALITEITFDPRMKNEIYRKEKENLLQKGFEGKILKSGLYGNPKLILNKKNKLHITMVKIHCLGFLLCLD